MTIRKRLTLTFSVFVFMLISTVTLVATVLASENQSLDSDLDLQYSGLVCEVKSNYYLAGNNRTINILTSNGIDTIYISNEMIDDGTEICLSRLAIGQNVVVNEENNFIVFEVQVLNTMNGTNINTHIVDENDNEYVNVSYKVSSTQMSIESYSLIGNDESVLNFSVEAGNEQYVYVKVELTDPMKTVIANDYLKNISINFSKNI